jgi:hypothetical protein
MSEFETLWRSALRFRRVSRELEPLVRDVYASFGDDFVLTAALERLLLFLASPQGRTDANCSVADQFVAVAEERWRASALAPILHDMGGTLHDSIHAPQIARTFEATPEQLLARLREWSSRS